MSFIAINGFIYAIQNSHRNLTFSFKFLSSMKFLEQKRQKLALNKQKIELYAPYWFWLINSLKSEVLSHEFFKRNWRALGLFSQLIHFSSGWSTLRGVLAKIKVITGDTRYPHFLAIFLPKAILERTLNWNQKQIIQSCRLNVVS
jgi:hypothetical protein